MSNVIVMGPRDKHLKGVPYINTTSRSPDNIWTQLSPFHLGPVKLWGGHVAQNMENGWQYSKVYSKHVRKNGEPGSAWLEWAEDGWANKRAVRYPMGKGAAPEFSWWDGARYGYVEARACIYIPLYAKAVRKTDAWKKLKRLYHSQQEIYLWDFDGYDRQEIGMSLPQVMTCPTRKMGHAFVLAMMLEWGEDFYRR